MASAGSAERPGSPARAGAGQPGSGVGPGAGSPASSRSRSRSRSGPPEEAEQAGLELCAPPGGGSGRGQPARRHSGGERLRRRSDPERSSSRPARKDADSRRELFVSPVLLSKSTDSFPGKLKVWQQVEDRDETRRRSELGGRRREDELGVLSDSENEEPISRRIRNISAFIRRTKNSSLLAAGCQRSRSCTDPVEDRGGKLKAAVPPAAMLERVGISHSFAAGILLSSENSRCVSAPITAPDRRPAWRAVLTPSTPPAVPPPRPERSISPESNDSISEELNHFKPIVCSPCTPPKRLPDGRLLEPAIVKSTPRNLTRGLQKATSYEASPAVLQKWRQIELDRQSLKVSSRATLTSPVSEPRLQDAAKTRPSTNKRRLLFEAPDADGFQKQSVKIRVPAVRAPRAGPVPEPGGGGGEPGGVGALFGRRPSFSPLSKNSGFQLCKLVPKDSRSPQKERGDGSIHNQSTSRRGKKRKQKTKHLDPGRPAPAPTAAAAHDARQLQQERRDRALALRLQRQFDLENQSAPRRRSPDAYCLRSWVSNQNRRRRGLRSSRRISKKL